MLSAPGLLAVSVKVVIRLRRVEANKEAFGLLALLDAPIAELQRLLILTRFKMVPDEVVLAVGRIPGTGHGGMWSR
jgi:hypothetical protein